MRYTIRVKTRGFIKKNTKSFDFVVLALAVLVGFTPLRFFALLLVIWILSRSLSRRFGMLLSFVLSAVLIYGVLAIFGALFWFWDMAPTSGQVLTLLCLATAFAAATRNEESFENKSITSSELVSLLVTAVIGFVLFMPFIPRPTGPRLAQVVMYGGDNSAHIQLVKVNALNGSNAFGLTNRVNAARNLSYYPQGWHYGGAITSLLLEPTFKISQSQTKNLLFYYTYTLVWFLALIFLLCNLALESTKYLATRFKTLSMFVPAGLVLIAASSWLVSLFAYGFQTQIAASVVLLVQLFFTIQYLHEEDTNKKQWLIVLLLGLGAVNNFMWLFLAPLSLGLPAVLFVSLFYKTKSYPRPSQFLGYATFGVLALAQPWIQYAFLKGGDNFFNQRGDVVKLSIVPLFLISVLCFAYAWSLRRQLWLRAVAWPLALALFFSLFAMWYQLLTIHEKRYYFYKSEFTVFILLVPLVAAAAQFLLAKYFATLRWRERVIAALTVMVLLIVGFSSTKSSVFIGYQKNTISGLPLTHANLIIELLARGDDTASMTAFYGACNRGDDLRALQLMQGLSKDVKTTSFSFFDLAPHNKYYFYEAAELFAKRTPKTIFVGHDLALEKELRAKVSLPAQTEFIQVDSSIETESILQCPDRIRAGTEGPIDWKPKNASWL